MSTLCHSPPQRLANTIGTRAMPADEITDVSATVIVRADPVAQKRAET